MSEFKFSSRFESRSVPAYASHQFASDLQRWFAITHHAQSGSGVDFIPFMEAYFNPRRGDAPSYQLAAAVYVMIVASQIILLDFEREEAARMCREKGWPVCVRPAWAASCIRSGWSTRPISCRVPRS